jgi:putative oxidoreductase
MAQAQVSHALPLVGAATDDKTTTRALVLTARVLYSLIFIFAAAGHFSAQTIAYAAAQGVPLANLAVPLSGILSLLGGLSVLLGYKARWGALALIVFLVPVTLMMHNFWAISDPMMKQMHMVMFMKNLGLMGGALLLYVFGAGPLSLDNRRARAA